MINSRVTFFSNENTQKLSEDVNTFIKWQEAIGNIIVDVKHSTCGTHSEVMVIWQMATRGDAIDIDDQDFIANITIEGIKLSIGTANTRIIQQFIDMKHLIGACQILAMDKDGEIEVIYERAEPTQPALIIPEWRKETEEE